MQGQARCDEAPASTQPLSPQAANSDPAPDPASGSQPYRLQAAAANGQPTASTLSFEDGQLFFAIDWAADASSQYEPEKIEQPQLHASVEEAKARKAAGPKPYTLDECIEVINFPPFHALHRSSLYLRSGQMHFLFIVGNAC